MGTARHRYRTVLGAASLVVGPGLMSLGDVMHPAEDLDAAAQVAIVAQSASRWYSAHLLLFVGLLLLVPGFLSLTEVAMDRKPRVGYAARVLLLVSVGAFSGVIVFEMLIGRFISKGADQATAVLLLDTFQSDVFIALVPGLLAFFVGIALVVVSLASTAGAYRWPALVLALGAVLILAEILSARVLLSQIGNVLSFVAGIAFARVLLQRPERASA